MRSGEVDSSKRVSVRRIKTSDFPRLVRILNSAFHREVSIVGLDLNRLVSFRKYHYIIEILYRLFDFFHLDYPTILVATIDNDVVGEVHLVPLRKQVWSIESLATDPAHSARGVGYNLIKGSIEFIRKRHGRRAISSIRADNTPALRIAEKLEFTPFQKTSLFLYESKKSATEDIQAGFSIRGFKSSDAQVVFDVCLNADPTTARALCLSPKSLFTPLLESLQKKLQRVQVVKCVLEEEGKIVGYTSFSYTSPNEAARIEYLCLHKASDSQQAAGILLTHVLRFLAGRKLMKVLISVSEDRPEVIETIQERGFRHIASFHEIAKDLDEHEHRHDY